MEMCDFFVMYTSDVIPTGLSGRCVSKEGYSWEMDERLKVDDAFFSNSKINENEVP